MAPISLCLCLELDRGRIQDLPSLPAGQTEYSLLRRATCAEITGMGAVEIVAQESNRGNT